MKKFIVLFIGVITLLFATNVKASKIELPKKTDHEKVKVYLFRGAGCSHCYDFLTYFADKYETYDDYFEIVTYESWNNSTNQNHTDTDEATFSLYKEAYKEAKEHEKIKEFRIYLMSFKSE